jgi:hypothetical protein
MFLCALEDFAVCVPSRLRSRDRQTKKPLTGTTLESMSALPSSAALLTARLWTSALPRRAPFDLLLYKSRANSEQF